MAITGTITGTTSNQYIDARITYSYSQDNAANTSTVTATLSFRRNNTGHTTSGTGTFSIAIGGTVQTINKYMNIGTGWADAVSITTTVSHNSDGAKSVNISASGSISGTTLTATSCSGTVKLNTIPRASTIVAASNKTLGNYCNVIWVPLSASFRYKLKFTLGGWTYTTGTIHPNKTTDYIYTGYQFPLDVARQFPNSTSSSMTVTLYTYSDSTATTQVGSASSKTITVTVPENESTKPTVSMSLSPETSYDKFKNLYLQGRSKVKATSFSGEGKYGATIKSYSMEVEGQTYSSPYISAILSKSGEINVVGTVTDSRGFTTTQSQKINVIAYQAPYISPASGQSKVICERCDEDGKPSDSGTYLHVKGTRNYTKINTSGIVNTCSVRCRYKPEGGSWSHDSGAGVGVLLWTDTSTDTFDVILSGIVSDQTLSYAVELNIIDDTYLPSVIMFNIPSENVAIHFREGGKGVAVGKYSQNEKEFECGWNARFYGNLYYQNADGSYQINPVIEQGTKDITAVKSDGSFDKYITWYYRKWADGSAECWCKRNVDVKVTTTWGSLFYGVTTTINYPFQFIENPICQITCEYGTDAVSLFIASSGTGSKAYATPVMLCRATSNANVNCNILYHAHGRWK